MIRVSDTLIFRCLHTIILKQRNVIFSVLYEVIKRVDILGINWTLISTIYFIDILGELYTPSSQIMDRMSRS
jgi:hypothetical protein